MALKFNAFFMIFLNIFHKIISLLVYTKEQKLDGLELWNTHKWVAADDDVTKRK